MESVEVLDIGGVRIRLFSVVRSCLFVGSVESLFEISLSLRVSQNFDLILNILMLYPALNIAI